MEQSNLFKSTNNLGATKSDALNTRKYSDVVPSLNIPKRKTIGEYVMVMHLADGVKVRAKTGSVNYATAKDLAYDGILFVEEEYGPVQFWNWEGEENVIRTVKSAFPMEEGRRTGLLGKLSSFIHADDLTEVERIRRRNARKAKFSSIKAKVNAFFEDDDFEEEYYEPAANSKPKTLKEKFVSYFYEEVEDNK